MVDAERIAARLDRLEALLSALEGAHARGQAAYLADEDLRAMTERRLQLAVQACIDVAAHIASDRAIPAPGDYAGIFTALGQAGVLPDVLAGRLAAAARQRNLLVHAYLELDDSVVFASLSRLDDLRAFAAAAQRLADEA